MLLKTRFFYIKKVKLLSLLNLIKCFYTPVVLAYSNVGPKLESHLRKYFTLHYIEILTMINFVDPARTLIFRTCNRTSSRKRTLFNRHMFQWGTVLNVLTQKGDRKSRDTVPYTRDNDIKVLKRLHN